MYGSDDAGPAPRPRARPPRESYVVMEKARKLDAARASLERKRRQH